MALHFLTILLQTGEFLRIHQLHHNDSSGAFSPLSHRTHHQHEGGGSDHSATNRPRTALVYPKIDFEGDDVIIAEYGGGAGVESGVMSSAEERNLWFLDSNRTASIANMSNIGGTTTGGGANSEPADAADWLVFTTLEILGISGWIGNLTLLIVIISSGLLERPSFIFIASLAAADVLHSTVTSCYFYPPIVLRMNVFSRGGMQFMNALDWTAWGITLTHMIAICFDRILAIILFQDYARLVTVKRAIVISLTCWFTFAGVNILFTSMQFCCVVAPQPEFYTFGFEDASSSSSSSLPSTPISDNSNNATLGVGRATNAYKPLYVPLECLSMLILAIGNPIILFNLYQKYRRKRTLRAASVVLMEVGQSLCRQSMNMDASLARDIKIFLQIIVVTIIFFAYMFIYYLFFYITEFSDKWSTMLNSICYSITHMINPVVYFSLNEQMQKQFKNIFGNTALVRRRKAAMVGRRNALCGIPSIVHAMMATAALSETSPLMRLSSNDQDEASGQHCHRHHSNAVSKSPSVLLVIDNGDDGELRNHVIRGDHTGATMTMTKSVSILEEDEESAAVMTRRRMKTDQHEDDEEEENFADCRDEDGAGGHCALTPLLNQRPNPLSVCFKETAEIVLDNNGGCKTLIIENPNVDSVIYGFCEPGDVFI